MKNFVPHFIQLNENILDDKTQSLPPLEVRATFVLEEKGGAEA